MNKSVRKSAQMLPLPYSTQLYQRHNHITLACPRMSRRYATAPSHSLYRLRPTATINRVSPYHQKSTTNPVSMITTRRADRNSTTKPVSLVAAKAYNRKSTNTSSESQTAVGSVVHTDGSASQTDGSSVDSRLFDSRLKISSDCVKILDNGFVTMAIVLVGYGKVLVESIIFELEQFSYMIALSSKSLPVTSHSVGHQIIVDTDLSDSQASLNVTFYFPYVHQVTVPMTVTYNIDQCVTHYLKFSDLPKVQETPGRIIKIDHSQFGTDLDYDCLKIKWGTQLTPPMAVPLSERILNPSEQTLNFIGNGASATPLASDLPSDAATAGVDYTSFQIIGDHQYVYYFLNQGEKIPVKYYQNTYESPIGHTFFSNDIQEIWIIVNDDRPIASRVPVAFNNSWIKINSVFQIIKKITLSNLRPNAMTLQFRVYPIRIPIRFKLVLNDSNLVLAYSETTPSRQNVTVRLSMSIGETFNPDSYLELQASTILDINAGANIMIEDCYLD